MWTSFVMLTQFKKLKQMKNGKKQEKEKNLHDVITRTIMNGETYGKLYNFYAILDKRGLAPEKWRMPSNNDLEILIDFIGGECDSSGVFVAGKKLKSNKGWDGNGNGTNEFLFNALPGGYRLTKSDFGGSFQFICFCGSWWISNISSKKCAFFWSLYSLNGSIGRNDRSMTDGLSVQCLRD